MFLRFVVHRNDEDSGRRQGLFQAIAELRDAGQLSPSDVSAYIAVRDWFNEHLEAPQSLSRSTRPHAKKVALSWFKDTAVEHIAKMYELAEILEANGVAVEVIRTRRPGYVVYDDRHQIAAEPFHETPT